MKKLILMLLFSCSLFAQPRVFNVQQYLIDNKPFHSGQYDVKGNEYSFIFLNSQKKEVSIFLAGNKFTYDIAEVIAPARNADFTIYTLTNSSGSAEMRINRQNTRIELLTPDKNIYLTVGKSTKLGT